MLGLGKATFGFEVIGRDLKFIALFEPVYKDLFMFNQTQIQLVHEYNCFSGRFSDENDEDIERQQRFHKHVSKRQDYGQFLKKSLRLGYQSSDVAEVLVCAGYLAYLINFEPQFEEKLELQRERYLSVLDKGLAYSQEVKRLYVMLTKGENIDLLREIKVQIDELTSVSNLQQIQMFMSVLGRKISWQLEKREIVRYKTNGKLQMFLDQLVAFLCNRENAKNQEILANIIKLVILVFKFLKKEIVSYRTMMLTLMQHWLTQKIFKNEIKIELFKVLKLTLEVFSLYKANLFYQFFSNNFSYIENLEYLQLLSSFLGKLSKNQRLNQSQIIKILKKLFSSVLQPSAASTAKTYRSKSMIIDQIIKISTLITCDLSKHLAQHFKHAKNDSHQALMISLLYIFDQRISAETKRTIEPHKLEYLEESKQTQIYEKALEHYCGESIDFQEFINNPQLMDDVVWEFLMIRTTVMINYNALCELNRVSILVVNLIKFVLLDILPRECLQIIEKILSNNMIYSLNELEQMSLATIINEIGPILMRKFNNSQTSDNSKIMEMYDHFQKIIHLITSKYEVSELKSLKLFESFIKFSMKLPAKLVTNSLMKKQMQLLETIMPLEFSSISGNELKISIDLLLNHLRECGSVFDFQLYLEMMNRGLHQQSLHHIFQEKNPQIEEIMIRNQQLLRMAENLEDIYKINCYIFTKEPFDEDVLKNCWRILLNLYTFNYNEFCYYIIDLFKYFSYWVGEVCRSSREEIEFTRIQLCNSEKVLLHLDGLISETINLKKIEELLSFKQAILCYLQEILQRYSEISHFSCEQLGKIHNYLFRAYQEMKSNKFFVTFEEEKYKIKEYWCNNQLMILLMIPSILKSSRNLSHYLIIERLLEIDERFEWLSKIYPKNHEKQIEQFSLCLNCELFDLQRIIKQKLMAAQTNLL